MWGEEGFVYLVNAFSLSMLSDITIAQHHLVRGYETPSTVQFFRITEERARRYLLDDPWWVSAVGHESTAEILSQRLGVHVAVDRRSVQLNSRDQILVAQLQTPRLPEGEILSAEAIRAIPITYWFVRYANSAELDNGLTGYYSPTGDVLGM